MLQPKLENKMQQTALEAADERLAETDEAIQSAEQRQDEIVEEILSADRTQNKKAARSLQDEAEELRAKLRNLYRDRRVALATITHARTWDTRAEVAEVDRQQEEIRERFKAAGKKIDAAMKKLADAWDEYAAVWQDNQPMDRRPDGRVWALRNRIRHYGLDVPEPTTTNAPAAAGVPSAWLSRVRAAAEAYRKKDALLRADQPPAPTPPSPRRWPGDLNEVAVVRFGDEELRYGGPR